MADKRNRADSKKATNDWLTPPELVDACGPFDLDPCCYPAMPWRTATMMVSNRHPSSEWEHRDRKPGETRCDLVGDGLDLDWKGRVWLNPPWDDPLPWAEKMARHDKGLMLVSAKSTETKWAQVVLTNATAVLFFKGRLLYHFPDGRKSTGAWTPSMLAGFGTDEVETLLRVQESFPGIILSRHFSIGGEYR